MPENMEYAMEYLKRVAGNSDSHETHKKGSLCGRYIDTRMM